MNTVEHQGLRETLLPLSLQGQPSVALLSEPAQAPHAQVAVLVIVGGPQYRVGAHRQFVKLARALAAGGYPVLRFDHRGLGDCVDALRSFEALDDDIDEAISALRVARPSLQGVVLWGLCDGAAATLLHAARRPQDFVRGWVLANPWTRSPQSEAAARVKHYYWDRLRNPAFWRKLLSGGVGLEALRGWWQARQLAAQRSPAASAGPAAFQDAMAQGWRAGRGPLLLQLCTADLTAQEFLHTAGNRPSWRDWDGRAQLERRDYAAADHTFSQPEALQAALADTLAWLKRHFPA